MSDYHGIPMKIKHLQMIADGTKTTTLRSIIYRSYLFEKKLINVPDEITDKIVKSEGYKSKEALIAELKSMRHKFPKQMFLYDLTKPLKLV